MTTEKKYLWTVVVGREKNVVMDYQECSVYNSLDEVIERLRFYENGCVGWNPLIIKIERIERKGKQR